MQLLKINSLVILGIVFIQSCDSTSSIEKSKTIDNEDSIVEQKSNLPDVEAQQKSIFNFIEDYTVLNSKTELIETFGRENVIDDTIWLAEGTVQKFVSRVTNPIQNHSLIYFWSDQENSSAWLEAEFYNWSDQFEVMNTQTIKSQTGLYTGMSLEELREWNEGIIHFAGFGWDYSGNVFPSVNDNLSKTNITIRLINKQEEYEGFEFIIGDVALDSDDVRMKGAPIVIETLSLNLKK